MDAIAVKRGKTRPERIDIERPEPDEGEVLVRTLRVGIDGTDFEVLSGSHGEFPEAATTRYWATRPSASWSPRTGPR